MVGRVLSSSWGRGKSGESVGRKWGIPSFLAREVPRPQSRKATTNRISQVSHQLYCPTIFLLPLSHTPRMPTRTIKPAEEERKDWGASGGSIIILTPALAW